MTGRIRIPLIVDIVRVNAPGMMRTLAEHGALDRGFDASGPLINRVIARRLRKILHTGTQPLPTVLRRDNADRAAAQAELTARLTVSEPESLLDATTLVALAAYVRGEGGSVGQLVQQLVGRLFVEDYGSTEVTWAAAVLLQQAVESNIPLKRLVWAVSGRIARAQRVLSDAAAGDPAAVHGTSIAVHNLVVAVNRLAALHRRRDQGAAVPVDKAVAHALVGPKTILRQADRHADSLIGSLRPGTLVTFAIREAGERSLDPRVTFMRDSWSACPAHRVVPAAIASIWSRAIAD